jgi:hypothetical protein
MQTLAVHVVSPLAGINVSNTTFRGGGNPRTTKDESQKYMQAFQFIERRERNLPKTQISAILEERYRRAIF